MDWPHHLKDRRPMEKKGEMADTSKQKEYRPPSVQSSNFIRKYSNGLKLFSNTVAKVVRKYGSNGDSQAGPSGTDKKKDKKDKDKDGESSSSRPVRAFCARVADSIRSGAERHSNSNGESNGSRPVREFCARISEGFRNMKNKQNGEARQSRQRSTEPILNRIIPASMQGLMSKFKCNGGNPTSSDDPNVILQLYEIGAQVGTAGHGLLWRIHDGIRKSDRECVSVFMFDKRIADKLYRPKRRDSILERLRHSVEQIDKWRHPKFVGLIHSLEESDRTLAFVTEPVMTGLYNILRHWETNPHPCNAPPVVLPMPVQLSNHVAPPPPPPDPDDPEFFFNYEFCEIELAYGILQLIDALHFMHYTGKRIHRNICPQVIVITKRGTWKMFGLEFCIPTSPNDPTQPVAIPPYSVKTTRIGQPLLDYMAPECQMNAQCSSLSDIFSLGLLVCAIFNRGRTVVNATNLPHLYMKQIDNLTKCVDDMDGITSNSLREALERMLSKDPSCRPTPQLLPLIVYFREGPTDTKAVAIAAEKARQAQEEAEAKAKEEREAQARAALEEPSTSTAPPQIQIEMQPRTLPAHPQARKLPTPQTPRQPQPHAVPQRLIQPQASPQRLIQPQVTPQRQIQPQASPLRQIQPQCSPLRQIQPQVTPQRQIQPQAAPQWPSPQPSTSQWSNPQPSTSQWPNQQPSTLPRPIRAPSTANSSQRELSDTSAPPPSPRAQGECEGLTDERKKNPEIVVALQLLDTMPFRDSEGKIVYYRKTLFESLSRIPKKLRWMTVWPYLCSEMKSADMCPTVYLPIMWFVNDSSQEEFERRIMPALRPMLRSYVNDHCKKLHSAYVFVENMFYVMEKSTDDEITIDLLPVLYRAMDDSTYQMQLSALICLKTASDYIVDRTINYRVTPRIKEIVEIHPTDTRVTSSALIVYSNNLWRIEKCQVNDVMVPAILTMELEDAEVVFLAAKLLKDIVDDPKYGVTTAVMATKLIPTLSPITLNPNLNLEQFGIIMELMYHMMEFIEQQQTIMITRPPPPSTPTPTPERRKLQHQMSTDNVAPPFVIPSLRKNSADQRKTSSAEDMMRKHSIINQPETSENTVASNFRSLLVKIRNSKLGQQMSSENVAPPFNIPNLRVERRKTSSAEDIVRKHYLPQPVAAESTENTNEGNFKKMVTGSGFGWIFGSSNSNSNNPSTSNDNNFLRVTNVFTNRRLSDNTLITPKIRVAPSCASSPGGTPGGSNSALPARRHSSIGPQERRGSNINLSPPTAVHHHRGRVGGSGSSLSVPSTSHVGGSMPNTSSSVPHLLTSSMQSIRSRRSSAGPSGSQGSQGILHQISSGVQRHLPATPSRVPKSSHSQWSSIQGATTAGYNALRQTASTAVRKCPSLNISLAN